MCRQHRQVLGKRPVLLKAFKTCSFYASIRLLLYPPAASFVFLLFFFFFVISSGSSWSPCPLCFSQVRKFVSKDSAGLRVRSHPSLQSEQIGIVHVNGTITFIDEVIVSRRGGMTLCLLHMGILSEGLSTFIFSCLCISELKLQVWYNSTAFHWAQKYFCALCVDFYALNLVILSLNDCQSSFKA